MWCPYREYVGDDDVLETLFLFVVRSVEVGIECGEGLFLVKLKRDQDLLIIIFS